MATYAAALNSICNPVVKMYVFKHLPKHHLPNESAMTQLLVRDLRRKADRIAALQPPRSLKSAASDLVSRIRDEASKTKAVFSAGSNVRSRERGLELAFRKDLDAIRADARKIGAKNCM